MKVIQGPFVSALVVEEEFEVGVERHISTQAWLGKTYVRRNAAQTSKCILRRWKQIVLLYVPVERWIIVNYLGSILFIVGIMGELFLVIHSIQLIVYFIAESKLWYKSNSFFVRNDLLLSFHFAYLG